MQKSIKKKINMILTHIDNDYLYFGSHTDEDMNVLACVCSQTYLEKSLTVDTLDMKWRYIGSIHLLTDIFIKYLPPSRQ